MKNSVFLVVLSLYLLTSCKTEVNPDAYLVDPTVQILSSSLAMAENDLETAEKNYLEAQNKFFETKKSLSDSNDITDTYFSLKERLVNARRKHSYYAYRLKYEKLAAQERYLRALAKNPNITTEWFDKERAAQIESDLRKRKAAGDPTY